MVPRMRRIESAGDTTIDLKYNQVLKNGEANKKCVQA
jgi:hypothetical protein